MAGFKKKTDEERFAPITITPLTKRFLDLRVMGGTPLYFNSMSGKAKRDLLLGGTIKNAAERRTTLKHNPLQEFRSSVNVYSEEECADALFFMPSTAFKKAITNAALDCSGATKTEISRLVWVEGFSVPVYGVPQFKMDVVRNKDIARTPDIRSRAYLPVWATQIKISFWEPKINFHNVGVLVGMAGELQGVGDFRPEKGAGQYGKFVVWQGPEEGHGDATLDPVWERIVQDQGRVAQQKAFDNPEYANEETRDLYEWFKTETVRRGLKVAA